MNKVMTYRELMQALTALSDQQLDCHILIRQSNDEWYPAEFLFSDGEDGVLDEEDPYFSSVDFDNYQ